MDWVLRSPQIHSTFSNLGCVRNDGYHVNENCNSVLKTILHNILHEDKYLRAYRRSISHGHNIQRDIIPLFMHTKDDKTVELVIQILVNLTIPVESLLNVPLISRTDYGRYTIFDVNNLLASAKVAFTDTRVSKPLFDFLKKNTDVEPDVILSEQQRTNVCNCLLLLRNILHIPEDNCFLTQAYDGSNHSIQNQIIWNIFSQGVDKIVIKFMTMLDASFWTITMVQVVALIYKDQHIVTLQRLLNNWLDAASISESSEDNESNTSPPDRAGTGSEDSSAMLTSPDSTSDSCDNEGGDKRGGVKRNATPMYTNWGMPHTSNQSDTFLEPGNTDKYKCAASIPITRDNYRGDQISSRFRTNSENQTKIIDDSKPPLVTVVSDGDRNKDQKQIVLSEVSDFGYGTHIENHESISTSSNDDELPAKKRCQKPHNAKQKPNNKPRFNSSTPDRKRKKMVKRGKASIINVQGLSHKTPSDEEITNVIKEFTVDFLFRGYNSLVQTLHSKIITGPAIEVDTSHFLWLISYFLKFASQIELDLERIDAVLSFEMVLYLTSEGVRLCEKFELDIQLDGIDNMQPNLRRQHLVVTAIQEFMQTVEEYEKNQRSNNEAYEKLVRLHVNMCETKELRSMFVLLLRHFNPKYHTKQYLQDLIVTNHKLLIFLDNGMRLPEYKSSTDMADHLRQFATMEIMSQYGLLLEDYLINGEYVNNCIFTIMHHVGGELDSLITLFQPKILRTLTIIWKSDFEICEDWTDLIEYVINTFVKKLNTHSNSGLFPEEHNDKKTKDIESAKEIMSSSPKDAIGQERKSIKNNVIETITDRWTDDQISALSWHYLQNNNSANIIDQTKKQLEEDGIEKTRESIVRELYRQNFISAHFYESQLSRESDINTNTVQIKKGSLEDEIANICEALIQDGNVAALDWVQEALLETCFTKLQIHNRNIQKNSRNASDSKLLHFKIFRIKVDNWPVVSAVAYHSLVRNQPVPLVPWNGQQAIICKDVMFLQLLIKLGFHLPVDSGMLFIRIPHTWTADVLFSVAGKIRPIDASKLKFSVSELSDSGVNATKLDNMFLKSGLDTKDISSIEKPDSVYQIHEQNHATMVNFTPRPDLSFKPEAVTEEFNWLQFVRKSQGRKIVLNLESATATTVDIDMELQASGGKICMTEPKLATPSSFTAVTSHPMHTHNPQE